MSDRIDDIFLPERLRRNWNHLDGDIKGHNVSEAPIVDPQSAMAELDHLRALIVQRFPGEQNYALNIMLDELHALLAKRFSQKEEAKSKADNTVTKLAIEELLNRIEDLVEALEL